MVDKNILINVSAKGFVYEPNLLVGLKVYLKE